jgi:hypothetical protein
MISMGLLITDNGPTLPDGGFGIGHRLLHLGDVSVAAHQK